MPTSSKGKGREEDLVEQLTTLFPNGDPVYFRHCLLFYQTDHVERVTEKIVNMGGYYPVEPRQGATQIEKLNAALRVLATQLFPDTDITHLRSLVSAFDHTHVEQATQQLVQNDQNIPERLNYGQLDRADLFRSPKYKQQVLHLLCSDFPQVWTSSIKAVLAENNWDYLRSYQQLSEYGSGGLWRTIRNFFVHWSFASSSKSVVMVAAAAANSHGHGNHHHGSTSTIDLDPDLIEDLGVLHQKHTTLQIQSDRQMAWQLNQDEYTAHGQAIVCDCCFGDYPFEQLVFCTQGTHSFCHGCLTHYVTEGLFGQGNLRGATRFPCIASDADPCAGCLPTQLLQTRVLTLDLWKAYELSLLETNMAIPMAQGIVVRCAACGYGEIDESTVPFLTVLANSRPLVWFAYFCRWDVQKDLQIAYNRIVQKRRGYAFQCRNRACGKLTCLNCLHTIRGLHACWENQLDGLRLYVEKAMADAVKRTCPMCNLSFQKSDGCNKIVCKCGYAMCYVCRKDIGKESYAHFCDHFRGERPGAPCDQCNKCDLYKTDPEDHAVQQAAARARREYLNTHPDVAPQLPIAAIGPKSRLDCIGEWTHESVLWVLQHSMDWLI
ncbi:hypothetical protein BC940DRAFT_311660 [Gongronella butleri]|nr:hypothetical protein BC940DRAFT_311660 [Gongronella butleri]